MSVPRAAIVAGSSWRPSRLPFLSALAVHAERGPVLIDAPMGVRGLGEAWRFGQSLGKLVGTHFQPEMATSRRVEACGFTADAVKHVLMTHLHWDHTGAIRDFGAARFHIHRDAWACATGFRSGLTALRNGYRPEDCLAVASNVDFFEPPAASANSSHHEDAQADRGVDLFGDGSVHAVDLPGHALGHVGYRIAMTDGREFFFVGDAVFCTDLLKPGQRIGLAPRASAHSVPQTIQTLERLRAFHQAHPDIRIIPSHDFELGGLCADGPLVL